jgi:hypothetical protein
LHSGVRPRIPAQGLLRSRNREAKQPQDSSWLVLPLSWTRHPSI